MALVGTAHFRGGPTNSCAPRQLGSVGSRELGRRGGSAVGVICVCLVTHAAAVLFTPDCPVPAGSDMRPALYASRSVGCHVFVF